jgi:hypothetical protein
MDEHRERARWDDVEREIDAFAANLCELPNGGFVRVFRKPARGAKQRSLDFSGVVFEAAKLDDDVSGCGPRGCG